MMDDSAPVVSTSGLSVGADFKANSSTGQRGDTELSPPSDSDPLVAESAGSVEADSIGVGSAVPAAEHNANNTLSGDSSTVPANSAAPASAVGQSSPPSSLVGQRVREYCALDEHPRTGLVFIETSEEFAVAFDGDGSWRSYDDAFFAATFEAIPVNENRHECSVRSVLLGRKGPLFLACGFLQLHCPLARKATKNGWECFEKYTPAPFESCPARYAEPPLPMELRFGSAVVIKPPFISLSGSKVGVNPMADFTGRVVAVLLGGSWNHTKQHMDKRRWVLVEHHGGFYLSPLNKDNMSAGNPAELPAETLSDEDYKQQLEKLVLDRTQASVKSA
eukprot:6193048-Pleurochrysis_carterae.AAC.1